ncbi:hypothetical protein ACVWZV_006138 [Bradyrhizobium sp. GM5.1]
MSDITSSSFVRRDLLDERPAPVKTTGFVGLVRTRLFNSPTNILLTIVGALLLWFTIIPSVKFLMVDAVWTGKDRTACLAENAGFTVGACWPYIQAKLPQLIYGFYPEAERWRVNLTLVLSVVLLVPLLIPRLPSKGLNAGLFFLAFPVVAFFLLHGGGIKGFGLSWTADLLQLFDDSIIGAGQALLGLGKTSSAAPLLWVVGNVIVLVGTAIYWLIFPLTWLRDQLQGTGQSVWADFAITAAIVSLIAFVLGGGLRTGGRALTSSIVTFAAIAIVIKLMGLDHGGLPIVQTNLWGGLLVTLVVSVTGIVTSLPIRHCAGAWPPLDHSVDPDLLDRLHRVLARRAADHRAVLCHLHAAAVSAGQFHGRWSRACADWNLSVHGRLSGRERPRRAGCDPARAGRGGRGIGAVLVEDDLADRAAAGATPRHSEPRQQLHLAVQGHFAGLDRGAVRSPRLAAGVVLGSEMVVAIDRFHRVRLRRDHLLHLLLWNVTLLALR